MNARETLRERLLANRQIDANGCWIWTKSTIRGYGQVTYPGPERNCVLAHRAAAFVWMDFDIFSDLCVLHRCDNPPCFNPAHLFVGTIADNQRDMAQKGRSRRGINPNDLSEGQIGQIRALVAHGHTRRAVALHVGVSHTTVVRYCRDLPIRHWTQALPL